MCKSEKLVRDPAVIKPNGAEKSGGNPAACMRADSGEAGRDRTDQLHQHGGDTIVLESDDTIVEDSDDTIVLEKSPEFRQQEHGKVQRRLRRSRQRRLKRSSKTLEELLSEYLDLAFEHQPGTDGTAIG